MPRRRHTTRPLLVGASLLAYLATVFGYPLPARDCARPVQIARACGCAPALQCQGRCCCVQPPAPAAEACPFCSDDGPSCCGQTTPPEPTPVPVPRDDGPAWALGPLAQQCHGLTLLWIVTGAALTPTVAVTLDALVPGARPVVAVPSLADRREAPPVPPPRAVPPPSRPCLNWREDGAFTNGRHPVHATGGRLRHDEPLRPVAAARTIGVNAGPVQPSAGSIPARGDPLSLS
jgi:hypothetical protein